MCSWFRITSFSNKDARQTWVTVSPFCSKDTILLGTPPSNPESLVTVPPRKESCCPSRGAVSSGRAAQIYERSLLLIGKLHHNSNLGNIVTVDRSIISRSQGRRIEGCKRDFRVLDTPRIMQLLQILRSDIFKTPE